MLPHVAYEFVYGQYDFQQPWNSPKNKDVAGLVTSFACPTHSRSPGMTNYVAVVGENTLWHKPRTPDGHEYVTLSPSHRTDVERDIRWPAAKGRNVPQDCLSKIVLVEMVESNIPWMEPKDVTLDEFIDAIAENPRGAFYNKYVNGIRAIDVAGRLTVIDPYGDINKIRNLFLVTGEEKVQ